MDKKNRVWSEAKAKGSESKSNIAYHGAINCGLLKLQKFGSTTFQVWLLFWVPHPHFWKIYAKFSDEKFNTESISTNSYPKNEKQKSLHTLSYLLFLILFWGHFNKTMLFPFFSHNLGVSPKQKNYPVQTKKNVLELPSKEKHLEQKERKNVILLYVQDKILMINKLHCRSNQRWRLNFIKYL